MVYPADLDTHVNGTSDSSEEESEDEGSSHSDLRATTRQATFEEEDVEEINPDAPFVIRISDVEDPFDPAEAPLSTKAAITARRKTKDHVEPDSMVTRG